MTTMRHASLPSSYQGSRSSSSTHVYGGSVPHHWVPNIPRSTTPTADAAFVTQKSLNYQHMHASSLSYDQSSISSNLSHNRSSGHTNMLLVPAPHNNDSHSSAYGMNRSLPSSSATITTSSLPSTTITSRSISSLPVMSSTLRTQYGQGALSSSNVYDSTGRSYTATTRHTQALLNRRQHNQRPPTAPSSLTRTHIHGNDSRLIYVPGGTPYVTFAIPAASGMAR
jgi:hypothetical protein